MAPRRRDAGRPRGKPIERAILAATLDELAAHGIEGLSVARIAAASEVNKTTVYRRWPTREALIAAALEGALEEASGQVVDTGSLRGDLRLMLDVVADRVALPGGRALVQAAMSDASAAAVAELSADPLVREQEAAVELVRRATERGEWDPARHLPDAVFAMITGAVLHRLLLERQPLTDAWADTVVDVSGGGLRAGGAAVAQRGGRAEHAAGPGRGRGPDTPPRGRALAALARPRAGAGRRPLARSRGAGSVGLGFASPTTSDAGSYGVAAPPTPRRAMRAW